MPRPKAPCGRNAITPTRRGSNRQDDVHRGRGFSTFTPTLYQRTCPYFWEESVTPTCSQSLPWEESRVDTLTPSHSPSFRTGVRGSESESKY